MVGSGAVITPSAGMWAIVRHADPPELVPDDLLPYVVPSYVDGRLSDWSLTSDVLAFGDVDVPTAYQRWRATWERAWPLDSHSNLVRLTEIARSLAGELEIGNAHLLNLAGDDVPLTQTISDPEELLDLADALEQVRDAIRERQTTGYGFIDVTEGRSRVGLAGAWSASGPAEVLSADRFLEVSMRPDNGLCVEVLGPPQRVLEGVVEVAMQAAGVEIATLDEVVRLGAEEAAAITWIVPGAARWRVRAIPEVLVWARTFGGLAESCRYAAALRRPLSIGDRATIEI